MFVDADWNDGLISVKLAYQLKVLGPHGRLVVLLNVSLQVIGVF